MRKFLVKFSGLFAALALCATTLMENSTCVFCMHQEKMPANSKKLRKF